ncbi:hypothetical protein GF314_00195 [bacterium]|nr:hypothetical protein [bacterium]
MPRSILPAAIALVAVLVASAAAQDEPRRATDLPPDGRYTVVEAHDDATYLEIRLDRVTGQTWRYDRQDRIWQTVPCEAITPEATDREPRYQIVSNRRSLWLIDCWGGRTWRWERRPRPDLERFRWAVTAPDGDVEGWHLIP